MQQAVNVHVMMLLNERLGKLQEASSDMMSEIIAEICSFKPDYSDYAHSEDVLRKSLIRMVRNMEHVEKQISILKSTERLIQISV